MSLVIIEVDSATALAADLFRAAFAQQIPDFPRHFVALHRDPSGALTVAAYIHYMAWADHAWLCGGLCVDRDAYERAGRTRRPHGSAPAASAKSSCGRRSNGSRIGPRSSATAATNANGGTISTPDSFRPAAQAAAVGAAAALGPF